MSSFVALAIGGAGDGHDVRTALAGVEAGSCTEKFGNRSRLVVGRRRAAWMMEH